MDKAEQKALALKVKADLAVMLLWLNPDHEAAFSEQLDALCGHMITKYLENKAK
jgi:hypothetical protein